MSDDNVKGKKGKINRKQIALIHLAKTKIAMGEDAYRDMLKSVGAASSKDLDQAGFDQVMERFEAGGFRSTSAKKKGKFQVSRKKGTGWVEPPVVSADKQPLMNKIAALLGTQGLSWAYADGIAKRMYGSKKLQWCTPQQLVGIVAALVRRGQREDAKREEGRQG